MPRCCARSETMLLNILYGAAAIGLAVYMVSALIRPDRF
jgi:K+-transporting ATPase KdpF subunit